MQINAPQLRVKRADLLESLQALSSQLLRIDCSTQQNDSILLAGCTYHVLGEQISGSNDDVRSEGNQV